jgi:ubiquitin-conjugating enzyme E2 Z
MPNIKRVMGDLANFQKNKPNNIFIHYDDSNIMLVKALIIGPEDTPYEGGFYFFELRFPDDYPFSPFKVKFLTTDGKIRFNPNLYQCGKVCLSIINTWSGPSWSPCQDLTSVLIAIQTMVMNDNPLNNEPGYDNLPKTDKKCADYIAAIAHENLRFAILKMLDNPIYLEFKNIIIDHFIKNYTNYKNFAQKYRYDNEEKKINGKYENINISTVYSMSFYTNFKLLRRNIQKKYKELIH